MFFFVLWYCLRIQKKHSSWLCFLCFFHKLLNKLVCNLFHSRQILDWIFWQTIQFFDFLFVHYKIQSKSKLKTMHNVMKNIEQNMIHQYIKHHKHHQIVSFIFAIFYDIKSIKLFFDIIIWTHILIQQILQGRNYAVKCFNIITIVQIFLIHFELLVVCGLILFLHILIQQK